MDDFKPIEPKKRYKIPDVINRTSKIRTRFHTKITFQRGYLNGQCAVRLFLKDKIVDTRVCSNTDWNSFDYIEISNNLYLKNFGFQKHSSAQKQREEALCFIIQDLFKALNFEEVENPFDSYTPDLVFKKGNCLLIIELKAFHKDTICAEPQINQIIKYALASIKLDSNFKKRFLLITSGKLIPFGETAFFQEGNDIATTVRNRYQKLLKKLWNPTDLDDYERKGMYYNYFKNFWKKVKSLPWDLDIDNRVEFYMKEISNKEDLDEFLDMEGEILVGSISYIGLQQIFKTLNKNQLNNLLKLLRSTPLEMLIINGQMLSSNLPKKNL